MAVSAFDIEQAVTERYTNGAQQQEPDLCCPVEYDPQYLAAIPIEVLERDYGCGDPSKYIREGEVVLDLGSGTGKTCFIASQVVGPRGRVIGVDMNHDMLDLARRYCGEVGERIGWHNVEFRHGGIQDLALALGALEAWLRGHPVTDGGGLAALEAEQARLRVEQPLIANESIDVIVSNCVLNLVSDLEKSRLFPEMFRVLRSGGRVAISDIVSDEAVPDSLKADPDLWSGCISGAMTETGMLGAFEDAGFHGIRILERASRPWRTVEGIEFRSMTVEAFKGKDGPCYETNKAVIYRGPWKEVVDDDGHVFRRGVRAAVCEKTFGLMTRAPYRGEFEPILPREPVDAADAPGFDCRRVTPRDPRETKGLNYKITTAATGPACEGPECC